MVYKDIWSPTAGEELVCARVSSNSYKGPVRCCGYARVLPLATFPENYWLLSRNFYGRRGLSFARWWPQGARLSLLLARVLRLASYCQITEHIQNLRFGRHRSRLSVECARCISIRRSRILGVVTLLPHISEYLYISINTYMHTYMKSISEIQHHICTAWVIEFWHVRSCVIIDAWRAAAIGSAFRESPYGANAN